MNELRARTSNELLAIATSKNYGRSTRAMAKKILEERGLQVDPEDFANPRAGTRSVDEATPMSASTMRLLIRIALAVLIVGSLALARYCGPS